jgi:hypothetical protein
MRESQPARLRLVCATRYEQPHLYQDRWDEFIRPPDGWWAANKDNIRRVLASLAARELDLGASRTS